MGDIYLASCPVCGRSLFKGRATSYIEGGCPKCKTYLAVAFLRDGVHVCVVEKQSEDAGAEHVSVNQVPIKKQ